MARDWTALEQAFTERAGNLAGLSGKRFTDLDLLGLLKRAIKDAGVPMKEICFCWDIKHQSHLNEMLDGTRPIPIRKLERLPEVVFERFVKYVCAAMGILTFTSDPLAEAMAELLVAQSRVARLATLPKRMAKADLLPELTLPERASR